LILVLLLYFLYYFLYSIHCYDKALQALLCDLDDIFRMTMIKQISTGYSWTMVDIVSGASLGSPRTHGVVLVGNSRHGMWPSLGQGGANFVLWKVLPFLYKWCKTIINNHSNLQNNNQHNNNNMMVKLTLVELCCHCCQVLIIVILL
jgi:hypothetical protein